MTDVMKEEDSMETTQPASLEKKMVKRMMEDSLLGQESMLLYIMYKFAEVVSPFKAIGEICI